MAEKITLLEAKLQNTEKEVLELRSLTGALVESGSETIGPFTSNTSLKYKWVISNTGNNYNPTTGIFSATVKGTYFFRFTMYNNVSPTPNSVVSLMKNDVRLTVRQYGTAQGLM